MKTKTNKNKTPMPVGSGVVLGDLPQDEGWYIAVPPMLDAKPEVVRVHLDIEKQKYVVDAVCQSRQNSEELWRYKEWSWSKAIIMPESPNDES